MDATTSVVFLNESDVWDIKGVKGSPDAASGSGRTGLRVGCASVRLIGSVWEEVMADIND